MAVLAVSATMLVQLHRSVIRGIARSDDVSIALDIASQRIEELNVQGADAAPACVGAATCLVDSDNFTGVLAPAGTFACTTFVDSAPVPMSNGTPQPVGTRFRVDTVVQNHPDITQLAGARLMTVSVCWRDIANNVRQVQSRRLLVPGA